MEISKLKIKIGAHEFEAEGPKDQVAAQFEAWKAIVKELNMKDKIEGDDSANRRNGDDTGKRPGNAASVKSRAESAKLFVLDEKRNLVTLRVHPTGDQRDADAIALVLLGYKDLQAVDEVGVTRIMESIKVSGLLPDRVDRAIAPHMTAGFLLKSGRGKGGKYRLSNTGLDYTRKLATELIGKLA